MADQIGVQNDRRTSLPPGAMLRSLETHPDRRGELTEFFRNEWFTTPLPVQWNVSRTAANVLRGVHVHRSHWDYLCVITGEQVVGLHDLRPGTPASSRSSMLVLNGARLQMLSIPPGVAHGFYSPQASVQVIGVSRYYSPLEDRRCRWNCPELGFTWPCTDPILSPVDRDAPGYGELERAFLAGPAAREQPA